MSQHIILTIPHETCVEKTKFCDLAALKLANQLEISLANQNRIIEVFHGDINRQTVDLNRKYSRETRFRNTVRLYLLEYIKNLIQNKTDYNITEEKIVYLIDCHSFTPGDHKYGNIRVSNPDISILFNQCSILNIIEELTDICKDHDLAVTKHYGIIDDIIDEFANYNNTFNLQKYGIKIIPILIELNENIEEKRMHKIGLSINEWIKSINQYLINQPYSSQIQFF
jgi:hypothetical protein